MPHTVIVGGGAAGLAAAYASAELGRDTLVVEKNSKCGKKIYITGKGRCNLTNDVSPEEFLENVVSNPKFLTSAIYAFPPEYTKGFFEERGLKLKVERGKRVFPASDKASDVTRCLVDACLSKGVRFLYDTTAQEIVVNGNKCVGVKTDTKLIQAEKIIIATGGKSYPSTGSTGDGYRLAQNLGHTIIPLKPALNGIVIKDFPCGSLAGLTLKNITLTAEENGKEVCSEFGELLFTHTGISGPVVLTISSLINRRQNPMLYLDLKPALTFEILNARVLRDFEALKNRTLLNSLKELLPSSLILPFLEAAELDPDKKNNIVSREERQKIVKTLKRLPLKFGGLSPIKQAVVTAGGVCVKEINPKTFESKIISGLYFAGEVIDVDAFTGGFNLQIAFSTGFSAGKA